MNAKNSNRKINLKSINPKSLFSNLLLGTSILTLVISVFISINNLLKLNDQPIATSGTTLLNQDQITQATTLIQEQTINFTIQE